MPIHLFLFVLVADFPSSVLEISEDEVTEWVSPKDLGIGKTININGRKFLMYAFLYCSLLSCTLCMQ